MKPKVLVTREIFDDVLEYLSQYFEVQSNQADTPMGAETLAAAFPINRAPLSPLRTGLTATCWRAVLI